MLIKHFILISNCIYNYYVSASLTRSKIWLKKLNFVVIIVWAKKRTKNRKEPKRLILRKMFSLVFLRRILRPKILTLLCNSIDIPFRFWKHPLWAMKLTYPLWAMKLISTKSELIVFLDFWIIMTRFYNIHLSTIITNFYY